MSEPSAAAARPPSIQTTQVIPIQRSRLDLLIIVGSLLFGTLIGICMLLLQTMGQTWSAVVCSGSCLAFGALIGFLFGIPRVIQKGFSAKATPKVANNLQPANADSAAPQPTATGSSGYHMQVNTNLEQISDWLTKIIVGLGLVELRAFPEHLNKLAHFMARGLKLPTPANAAPQVHEAATQSAEVLATMVVVYFSLMGFYGGYLTTRTYLTGAFRRADEENLTLRISAHSEASIKAAP